MKNIKAFKEHYGSRYEIFINMDLFFTRELSDEELKPYIYSKIDTIIIIELNQYAYIYNLKKLDKITSLELYNIHNKEIFGELHKLKNLKRLRCIVNLENTPELVTENIVKCQNICDLIININDIYTFPSEFIQFSKMKKLQDLTIYHNNDDFKFNDIPNEIIKNKSLFRFYIRTDIKFLVWKNMVFIIDYDYTDIDFGLIPPEVNHMRYNKSIITYEMCKLPKNIEILNLDTLIIHKISNFSPTLKEINAKGVYYLNVINTPKIPYGCTINTINK